MEFDFYYGLQSQTFSFYRIPKLLFTDSRFSSLSAEAKTLYGILLDRMDLSMKNGWLDKQNRVYLFFTVQENQLPRCKHSSTVLGSYVTAHSTCLSLLLPQDRKRGMKISLSLFLHIIE